MQPDRSLLLKQDDLPAFYQATDTAAKRHQRWFIVSIVLEIAFALVGAAALVLGQNPNFVDAVGSVASVQFLGATVVPLSVATAAALLATAVTLVARYVWKPGDKWRESRYLGERCATFAWRYAARATPVDLGRGQEAPADANRWYLDQIAELQQQARPLDLPDVTQLDQLTPAMSALRDAPVEQRFKAYMEGRAIDQRNWYDRRARKFRRLRNTWRATIVLIYIVGASLVLAHATALRDLAPLGLLAPNYWPLVAAAAGAVTGYVAARHYEDLQQSYRYVCERLSGEIDAMRSFTPSVEREVSEWVDRVETLMDSEHQQWHALG